VNAIRPLLRELALAYYQRALREIDPLHKDVPFIVLRIHTLTSERSKPC
jgi:hypothetical protein